MKSNSPNTNKKKKGRLVDSAFIGYAVFVFAAFAIGLIVILMRSKT